VNFLDTADTYSAGESEILVGKFVREFGRRDEMVIATKVYNPVSMDFTSGQDPKSLGLAKRPNQQGLSRKRIFAAIDASLQRLKMDHVDLYQIHRWDYATPVEEFMEALHDVVKSGKARYIGASAWPGVR
jgi:aryl-alcohol dehydrogenase (NADP+)